MTLEILHDHPGTRIGAASVEGRTARVAIRREPMTRADWTTHDYNVHFCVGLRNAGPAPVEAELSIDGGRWEELPEKAPLLFAARAPAGPYAPASLAARTDLGTRYAVRVPLAPGERIYLANTLVRDPPALLAEFDALAAAAGAERQVFGRSLEGRELAAYRFGDGARRPALLVTSGFHPPEPDTLASAAILRWLATPEGARLSERFAVVVAPLANPDGYFGGTQGANAAGINLYWHFARELPARAPEAAALWELAAGLRPRGYIDFHCYTFQLRKSAGPYLKPPFFYEAPAAKEAAAALEQRFRRLPGTAIVRGFPTYAPHTLGAMLTEAFDTVTLAKYHLHLKDGVEACGGHGVAVLRLLAEVLEEAGLATPAAPRRAGWRAPARRSTEWWAGLLRPQLGELRRGRLHRLRFDRTGADLP